nr:hypothetical protein [Serratia fonticola]
MIPLLYAPSPWLMEAGWRIAGLLVGLLFLLLLAIADRLGCQEPKRHTLTRRTRMLVSGGVSMLALAIAVMMGAALSGALTLRQVERQGLVDITPLRNMSPLAAWVHHERKMFNEQVNALLRYNQSRDEQLLTNYSQWAQSYLRRRIDSNVYMSLIQILQHQQQSALAEQYRWDALRLFPGDARFQLLPVVSDADHKEMK